MKKITGVFKVKGYEVHVEDGVVTHIFSEKGLVHAYKYDEKYNSRIIQTNLKFNAFKSGVYKGSYKFY